VPDDLDIASLTSVDANGDGIPDECQADMDGNGVFDWVDIFEDMSLDIDRDGVLDAVQDCDGDGVPDILALDHAHNIWAVSSGDARIKEYHYRSGVLREQSAEGELVDPIDVLVTLDRRVLVSDAGDGVGGGSGGSVVEYDRLGVLVRELVAAGSGGLLYPSAMVIAPDGSLLVADRDANSVLRFDVDTGDFLGVFVEAESGGLMAPYGLAFGPSGNLFVNTDHAGVIEYDGVTGTHVRQFIEHGAGDLHHGRGILFIPRPASLGRGWRCLVTNGRNHNVLEFDADTGAYVGVFNEGDFRGRLRDPWGLRLGPNGNVFVSSANLHTRTAPPPAGTLATDTAGLHLTRPHIFQYDGASGKLINAYVQAIDSGLDHPKGFDFMPGPLDQNANAIPDACETACIADCDGSGTIDLIDFLCFQNAFDAGDPKADCTADGVLDVFDFLCFLRAFDAGCP
jgi:sugar lactone lactonase YvrE